jgi:hypothetical protein
MKRILLATFLALGVVLFFTLPLIPIEINQSNSADCPGQEICGVNNNLNEPGYGSLTFRLFGVGIVWWFGHFQVLQKGCADTGKGPILLHTCIS